MGYSLNNLNQVSRKISHKDVKEMEIEGGIMKCLPFLKSALPKILSKALLRRRGTRWLNKKSKIIQSGV